MSDLYSVLAQYEILTVLKETFGQIGQDVEGKGYSGYHQSKNHQTHSSLDLPTEFQPKVLLYTAQDFGNELKFRLSCLEASSALWKCIDATVEAIEKRLDATQDLIDTLQELEALKKYDLHFI